MAKDQDKTPAPPVLQAVPLTSKPETIELPLADVLLLQEAATEVAALREAKAAAESALASSAKEAAEYLRIGEADANEQRARATELARDLARERARADGLSEQCQGLIGDLAGIQAQLVSATSPTKEAAEVEPLRPGHRRVYTLQPYRFDSAQGPRSVPRGTVMQVPEKDFTNDSLRRFPHLRDHAEHAAEVARNAKRDAMPVDHASRNLEAVHARVADVVRIREQQRDDFARRISSPDYIASQLPR